MPEPASGGCDFLADPDTSADHSPVFWQPAELAPIVILATAPAGASQATITLADLPAIIVRRDAADGTHLIVRSGAGFLQLWVTSGTDAGAALAAAIPVDALTLARADALARLWETLARAPPRPRSSQRRRIQRLIAALRALDARLEGMSYRTIAEAFFGAKRIADEPWKTSSLRDQVIRLSRTGVALMRGGYCTLLRPKRTK